MTSGADARIMLTKESFGCDSRQCDNVRTGVDHQRVVFKHPGAVLDDSRSKETPLEVYGSESLRRGVQRRSSENGIEELPYSHDGQPKYRTGYRVNDKIKERQQRYSWEQNREKLKHREAEKMKRQQNFQILQNHLSL